MVALCGRENFRSRTNSIGVLVLLLLVACRPTGTPPTQSADPNASSIPSAPLEASPAAISTDESPLARNSEPLTTTTPASITTTSATPWPSTTPIPPYEIRGAMALDLAGDRIFAQGNAGAEANVILILSLDTGDLIDTLDASGAPVIASTAGNEPGRLILDDFEMGLSAYDLETLRPLATIEIPKIEDVRDHIYSRPTVPPLFDPSAQEILVFRNKEIHVVDRELKAIQRNIAPFPEEEIGDIRKMELDEERRWLYVAAHDRRLPAYLVGSRLRGLDLGRGATMILEHVVGDTYAQLLAWDGFLVAINNWERQHGQNRRIWKDTTLVDEDFSWNTGNVLNTSRLLLNSARTRLYQQQAGATFVFEKDGHTVDFVRPDGVPGELFFHDPQRDRHIFLHNGQLHFGPVPRDRRPVKDIVVGDRTRKELTPNIALPNGDRFSLAYVPGEHYTRRVYRSRAKGTDWRQVGGGIPPDSNVTVLKASPGFNRDHTLFVATRGNGIFKSTDRGRTWRAVPQGPESRKIERLHFSPSFSDDGILLAKGFSYWAIEQSSDQQVEPPNTAWRSEDGGETWQGIGRFMGMAFSPDFENDQRIWAIREYGTEVFESRDHGRTWQQVGTLPEGELDFSDQEGLDLNAYRDEALNHVVLLAVTAGDSGVYGDQWPRTSPALFRSTDAGRSWELVNDMAGWVGIPTLLGPFGPDHQTLVLLEQHLHISTDLGHTWRQLEETDSVDIEISSAQSVKLTGADIDETVLRARLSGFLIEP